MVNTVPQLEVAYEQCRLITQREAKNFYYAFITLPHKKRKAIYAAYAFCRLCDDAADDDIPTDKKLRLLEELRGKLSMAYSGRPDGPVFTALSHAAGTFDIPEKYLQEVISGVETDLTKTRYRDFGELRTYCYQVASVVGLICIQIFGYSHPRAKEYAIDLGLAMQLTNILRDIKEDLKRDRIYLPLDDLRDFGYSVDELKTEEFNRNFRELMEFEAQRARQYFGSGFKLLPFLSPRSRACPAVIGQIYSHILDRIEAQDFNVFDGRVSLSKREKYMVTAQTWVRSLLPTFSTPT
jgi:phytoene synthase